MTTGQFITSFVARSMNMLIIGINQFQIHYSEQNDDLVITDTDMNSSALFAFSLERLPEKFTEHLVETRGVHQA